MKLQKLRSRLTQRLLLGLKLVCLTLLLTSCGLMPSLKATYVPIPTKGNLALLCDPVVPLPPRKPMTDRQLKDYVILLQDEIKECALQQQQYRDELDRLIAKAKTRYKL